MKKNKRTTVSYNERQPFFVSPEFKQRVKEIQGKLLINGERKSLPDITQIMVKVPSFENVEKEILRQLNVEDSILSFNMKLDTKKLLR